MKNPESRWVIFGLSILLFSWPFISFENSKHISWIYLFLFASWILSVVLIYFFIASEDTSESGDAENS